MQEPPPRYNPPPGEPPTEPTRRVVDPYAPAAVEQEYALDPVLAEKIDRASFWSRFGSAAAVAAAILGIIALFVALDARDKADNAGNDGGQSPGLRSDVDQLQSDVNRLERQVSSAIRPEQRRRLAAVRYPGPAEADLRRPAEAGAGHPERAAGPLPAERPRGPGRAGSGGRGRRRAIAAAAKIVVLPGDGIGPEVDRGGAAAPRCARAPVRRRLRGRTGARSAASRSTSTASRCYPRCWSAAAHADAVLLGAVGGPQVGHDRPRRASPGAGTARPAQGPRAVRQPAPGARRPGARERQPAARGARPRRRRDDRPRADGRHLLRRPRARATASRTTRASTPSRRSSGSPSSRSAMAASPRRRRAGRLRRQGEHPRDVAPVAGDGRAGRHGLPGCAARAHAGR